MGDGVTPDRGGVKNLQKWRIRLGFFKHPVIPNMVLKSTDSLNNKKYLNCVMVHPRCLQAQKNITSGHCS